MRIDAVLSQHLRSAGPQAQAAQQQGFGRGWISETVADPFAASAVALLATDRLGVGTAVSVAFARSPFAVAQSAWELSRASGGRFSLGLGTQVRVHAERRFSVDWAPPVERLRDYIGALRAIWDSFQRGVPLRYEGEFYRHTLLGGHFDPGPIEHPRIPVLVSGVNVRIAELAGEVADGLIAHPLHTTRYLDEVLRPAIRRGADRAGRDPGECSLVVPVWVVGGPDAGARQQAEAAVRRQIGTYAATSAYRVVLEVHGWGDLQPRLNRAVKDGGPDAAAVLVPDGLLAEVAVSCPPAGLDAALETRLGGRADAAMLYPPVPPGIL